MSDRPVILYSYAMSPYAAKVHGMLHFKGLDFTVRYINPLRARAELPVGRQVPVLQIGDEARNDSTPIGLWLDEVFPDSPPLLPPSGAEREKLIAIDDWATNHLIPATFRTYPGEGVNKWINGWKLGHVMARTAHSGLPPGLKWLWPGIVTRVGFVRRMIASASENGLSLRDAKFKIFDDFPGHLEGGPFLGGRQTPSLPDFSCYPQFALVWMLGFRGADDILQCPELMTWLAAMKPFIDKDPPVTPTSVRINDFPLPGGSFRTPFFPGG